MDKNRKRENCTNKNPSDGGKKKQNNNNNNTIWMTDN